MAYDPSNPDYNGNYQQQFYPSEQQQMYQQQPQTSSEIMMLKTGLDMANARIESLIALLEQMKEQNHQLILTNHNLSNTNKNLSEQNENSQLCVSMLSQLLKSVNDIKSNPNVPIPTTHTSDLRFTKKPSADKTSESSSETSTPIVTITKKPTSASPPSLKRPQTSSQTVSTAIKKPTTVENSSNKSLKRNISTTSNTQPQQPPKLRKVVD